MTQFNPYSQFELERQHLEHQAHEEQQMPDALGNANLVESKSLFQHEAFPRTRPSGSIYLVASVILLLLMALAIIIVAIAFH